MGGEYGQRKLESKIFFFNEKYQFMFVICLKWKIFQTKIFFTEKSSDVVKQKLSVFFLLTL